MGMRICRSRNERFSNDRIPIYPVIVAGEPFMHQGSLRSIPRRGAKA
jgi:hypothetical protein